MAQFLVYFWRRAAQLRTSESGSIYGGHQHMIHFPHFFCFSVSQVTRKYFSQLVKKFLRNTWLTEIYSMESNG